MSANLEFYEIEIKFYTMKIVNFNTLISVNRRNGFRKKRTKSSTSVFISWALVNWIALNLKVNLSFVSITLAALYDFLPNNNDFLYEILNYIVM